MILVGGPVFWILMVLAVVSTVIFFERFFDLRRAHIDYQDFIKGVVNILDTGNDDEALAVCDDNMSPVANVVSTAIRHRYGSARVLRDAVDSQGRAEVGRLDRRMASLAILGQITPLVGLLGTLIGFAKAILLVNSAEVVSRVELMTVSMEAVVSAALGIAVAIPITVMYGSLRVRLDRIVVELEAAASQIVGYVSSQRDKERGR